MKLSQKKKADLYSAVMDEVVVARIKIALQLQELPELGRRIDDILSNLGKDAPQAALDVFEPKPKA